MTSRIPSLDKIEHHTCELVFQAHRSQVVLSRWRAVVRVMLTGRSIEEIRYRLFAVESHENVVFLPEVGSFLQRIKEY